MFDLERILLNFDIMFIYFKLLSNIYVIIELSALLVVLFIFKFIVGLGSFLGNIKYETIEDLSAMESFDIF